MENIPPVQMETLPAQDQTLEKSPKKKILRITGIIVVCIIIVAGLLFIGLLLYFIFNPDLTEQDILNRIRSDIAPSVVQVRCLDFDEGEESRIGTGLYYFDETDNTSNVETNAHVVLGTDKKFHGCNVYFPRPIDGTFYEVAYTTNTVFLYNDIKANVTGSSSARTVDGIDYAILTLAPSASSTDPFPPAKPDAYSAIESMCSKNGFPSFQIGDKVYLLGYPETGSDSLTITDGILSGFTGDYNEWFKISASSNHGNSGGITIGATNGCNYGILTRATFAQGSNLGYVLSADHIRDFINNATEEKTYSPPMIEEGHSIKEYLTQTYEFPEMTIRYPNKWKVATTSFDSIKNRYIVDIYSPNEGAVDYFIEALLIYVYPHGDKNSFTTSVADLKKFAKKIDKKNTGGSFTTRDNVTIYQNVFKNETGEISSTPFYENDSVFLYKDTLYNIRGIYETVQNTKVYHDLFKGMIDSIEFK